MCDGADPPPIGFCLKFKLADELGGNLFLDEEDVVSTEPSLDIPSNFDWIFCKTVKLSFFKF
jgi:hypothetical protein